ncbi:MAG: hypothetical protein GX608_13440 [Lentisphaerae bacterium]|nr:hypothetical protein [Lentisphaerota bacterium]
MASVLKKPFLLQITILGFHARARLAEKGALSFSGDKDNMEKNATVSAVLIASGRQRHP